ncbi:MAG: adenine phosphoribosyltransferase, partial [Planctomycetes bacterium]|nr:adenine phosphoribosyltransferase [Planctomycetota bacterium]
MEKNELNLTNYIRNIPDWPKKGILFRDITPLLADGEAFAKAVKTISDRFRDEKIDYVAAVEARGFIFGAAV